MAARGLRHGLADHLRRRRSLVPRLIAGLALLLSAGCADPCSSLADTAVVTLAGADEAGFVFEEYADGAPRDLIYGLQGGMHVWLQIGLDGICAPSVVADRRLIDDATGEILDVHRGPVRWADGPDAGSYLLETPEAMLLCPAGRSVIGETFRMEVSAEDGDGRRAEAALRFVATCASGACDPCTFP